MASGNRNISLSKKRRCYGGHTVCVLGARESRGNWSGSCPSLSSSWEANLELGVYVLQKKTGIEIYAATLRNEFDFKWEEGNLRPVTLVWNKKSPIAHGLCLNWWNSDLLRWSPELSLLATFKKCFLPFLQLNYVSKQPVMEMRTNPLSAAASMCYTEK